MALPNRRLTLLGVPANWHAEIESRRPPPFHILVHVAIVIASIALAVAAIAAWSRYAAANALEVAAGAHALLYDSDIGAESLGVLFAALFAGGWLCGFLTWRRGSENARNGWATDLVHEPAKNKAATNWIWRQMIRRHTRAARNADEFLDSLGRGMVRDLRLAFLVMIPLTAALAVLFPAHVSYATDNSIVDHPLLPVRRDDVQPIGDAVAIVTGCPVLPKEGSTLVYQLRFPGGMDADIGTWQPLSESRLDALDAIAARLPAGIHRERFSNPIGSDPLAAACIKAIDIESGNDGVKRLIQLLTLSEFETKVVAEKLSLHP